MSTILESVNTLSDKLGVTEREQTIKDQLDLCVERLGGEGNSKDIADSAEKFAEKEDGTATFMTKTITENNTYNAADDGVSGYSSVTVNVPFTWERITIYKGQAVNNDSEFTLTFDSGLGNHTLVNPLTKYVNKSSYPSFSFAFTPAEDFDGIYRSNGTSKYSFTGDEVTAGDGYIYVAEINDMGSSYTMTKKEATAESLIEIS